MAVRISVPKRSTTAQAAGRGGPGGAGAQLVGSDGEAEAKVGLGSRDRLARTREVEEVLDLWLDSGR